MYKFQNMIVSILNIFRKTIQEKNQTVIRPDWVCLDK